VIVFRQLPHGSFFFLGNLQGTGTTDSGTRYVIRCVNRGEANPSNFTVTQRTALISKGSDPNLLIDFTFSTQTGVELSAVCVG
jgi:hypothetical protein